MALTKTATRRIRSCCLTVLAGLALQPTSFAHEHASVLYLGNEGVMVEHGDTKVLFDPLFRNDYGHYELLSPETERALLAGEAPFDGVDAVFISHYHGDHYEPSLVLSYLQQHDSVQLYAPTQAIDSLTELIEDDDEVVSQLHSIELAYKDEPLTLELGELLIEATHVPHSGWPGRMLDVQNIAFRVTLNDEATVLHLGDADADAAHFENQAEHWQRRRSQLAMPPYWFLLDEPTRDSLLPHLNADKVIGIHVPKEMPDNPEERPPELGDSDLFTRPGETRVLIDSAPTRPSVQHR